jgi:hypothetical protein
MLTNYLRDKEQLYYATSTYQHRHHRSSNRNKSVIVLLKNTNSSLSFFFRKNCAQICNPLPLSARELHEFIVAQSQRKIGKLRNRFQFVNEYKLIPHLSKT